MDKCPYCLSEIRPGDNFCLNCGNRLTPASSVSDATIAAPDNWGGIAFSSPPQEESHDAATILNTDLDQSAYPLESTAYAAQPTTDHTHEPAQLILRGDKGDKQEFTLDKPEMTIGRAPTSDVVLAKDKLTSRRHATLRYDNGNYYVRDESSANGTFVNGQQLETMTPFKLKNGDLIGIGEYELVFRDPTASSNVTAIEDMPTQMVGFQPIDVTARTQSDDGATMVGNDPYRTRPAEDELMEAIKNNSNGNGIASTPAVAPSVPVATSYVPPAPIATSVPVSPVVASGSVASTPPVASVAATPSDAPAPSPVAVPMATPAPSPAPRAATSNFSSGSSNNDSVTFSHLNSIVPPILPDMSALMAAMSTLDGQVSALQEQLNATQEAMRNHENEIAQTSNQLRTAVRRVSDRMDSTIADVARSREALAWADLIQLMEDVMNNPRDIEYVGKLARKARELNKVFQIHQTVLNTMAECNSLLRSVIGEEK